MNYQWYLSNEPETSRDRRMLQQAFCRTSSYSVRLFISMTTRKRCFGVCLKIVNESFLKFISMKKV